MLFSSTTICDPPRVYPFLPEDTPLLNNYNIMRRSQNLPLSSRIYLPFQQLYVTLPESTPPSRNIPLPLSLQLCVIFQVVVVNHCFTSLFGTKGLLSDIVIRYKRCSQLMR